MELVVHPRNVYLDILQDLREESEYFDEGLTEISKATRRKNGLEKSPSNVVNVSFQLLQMPI